jgi:hypothetical protein
MLNTRKFQTISVAILIVAAALVSLSAIGLPALTPANLSWPPRTDFSFLAEKAFIPVTGNEAGLNIYHQSERVSAYPVDSAEAGLAQYHSSEWTSTEAIQNGMDIYHQSEHGSLNATNGLAIYHQSE